MTFSQGSQALQARVVQAPAPPEQSLMPSISATTNVLKQLVKLTKPNQSALTSNSKSSSHVATKLMHIYKHTANTNNPNSNNHNNNSNNLPKITSAKPSAISSPHTKLPTPLKQAKHSSDEVSWSRSEIASIAQREPPLYQV